MNPFAKMIAKSMSPEEAYRKGELLYGSGKQDKALPYYLHAAQNGHGYAQHTTAECYSKGYGCAPDPKQAQYWYERAAEHGYPKSQYLCAETYAHGQGCTHDAKKALYWYEKAAEQAKPGQLFASASITACAVAYERGRGCAVDLEKALYWYEKCRALHLLAAEDRERNGSVRLMNSRKELAVSAHEDVNRIRAALGLAPEPMPLMAHEAPAAITNAEQLLAEGMACLDTEPEKACALLKQAAELRNPEAQFQYGQLLRFGKGCKKDMLAALRMLENAAEQGHVLAQRNLGMIYLYGKECHKKHADAGKWLKKAAAQNDPEAFYHLGMLELPSWTGLNDNDQARIHLRQAMTLGYEPAWEKLDLLGCAYHGELDAMYRLGMLIVEVGDPSDWRNKGRHWLRMASSRGHKGAHEALNTVARNLPGK